MALSDGYLSLYTIDPATDHYVEYTCSDDYATLGAPKEGEDFFRQLIDDCDTAYLTKIDHVFDADAFFPDIDAMPQWHCVSKSEEQTYFNLVYYFTEYRKQA